MVASITLGSCASSRSLDLSLALGTHPSLVMPIGVPIAAPRHCRILARFGGAKGRTGKKNRSAKPVESNASPTGSKRN